MTTKLSIAVGVLAFNLAACQCGEPCNPEIDDDCPYDAGPTQPDLCNTPNEGLTDSSCILPLACGPDAGRFGFINPSDAGIDQDWYSATFGTLTARTLLHVQAGYLAPVTPVDLSVTVLQNDNGMPGVALIRKVDDHGQGAPKLIDILKPYTESNGKLLFLLADKGGRLPVYDVRNPYFISVCTQENPDMNEPNDAPDGGATQIPLTAAGGVLRGMQSGYLATDNDVDRFQFVVPAGAPAPRDIVYVHITTAEALMPPPPYRLSYTLYDPNNVPISEGVTDNAFLKVDLATSRLVRVPGTYTLVLQGYKQNPNDPTVVQGDLRQKYDIDVQVMEDLDREEPNDSMGEAAPRVMTLSPGNSVTKTGRLSYVPDPEFFAFDIPASGNHATMSVKLTVAQASGRFAPLNGRSDRQLRVMSAVPGTTVPDSINRCLTDFAACPKGYDPNDSAQADLVAKICTGFADAGSGECLWLERNANLDAKHFQDLKNMAGVIPVPPRGATTRYWVVVGDDGNNWADDVDWTLSVSLADDSDEARYPAGGGLTSALNGSLNGELTYGFGRVLDDWDLGLCARNPNGDNGNSNNCHGVRSPFDYDAVPSDVDTYSFNLGLGSDQAWGLQWDLFKVDGGTLPSEISIDLSFCGNPLADGGCSIRTTTAYQSGTFSPWYSDALPDRVVGWSRQDMGSFVRVTATQAQCLCFQRAFTQFKMAISVADRNYYAPMAYRVTQTAGAYSGTFIGDGGMTATCGPVAADAGPGAIPACGLP
ncbi:MAG: hypothetical protein IPJ65_20730 [Archangiaceae bacterium]|nr:hypothetical protein [Archangiaceae bacterium]